ncbi:MAG: hypothetical protein OXL36_05630, partial [Bryobacterales bacterium]|nr:hypothetical protein [Bryobacterales bacterium]MDE0295517.1 hypothetical protein [Bryobacterales bacterium]
TLRVAVNAACIEGMFQVRAIYALDTAIHSQRESDPVPGGHVGFPFLKRLAGANRTNGSGAAPFAADLHRTRFVSP